MNAGLINKTVVGAAGAVGIVALCLWICAEPSRDFTERVPGMDRQPASRQGQGESAVLLGALTLSEGTPSDLPGTWPNFRGPNLDNISRSPFKPVAAGQGFPECWSVEMGEGHAGAAVWQGRVYVLDYDREGGKDTLRCLSLDDGREIWRYAYPVKVKRNHGMSRTVPAVTEGSVVALGPKCHVICCDPVSGEYRWSLDLVRDFGTKVPPWYAGQCPLIDGDRAIIAPGGVSLVMAVALESGEVLWESSNDMDWKMTHASILPMEFGGERFYVYCGSGGVVGVSATDGRILWATEEWRIRMATVPTPVDVGQGRIFLSGGYEAGSMMLQLEMQADRIVPRGLFRLEDDRFGSAQQTPILFEDHIFGVRPDGQLVCLDLEGNEVWTSTGAHKFGLGPYAVAGDLIYVMNDHGLLSRVVADPDTFRLVDQTQVLQGHDSWGPMAFAKGRLIVRDLTRMVCLDVAED